MKKRTFVLAICLALIFAWILPTAAFADQSEKETVSRGYIVSNVSVSVFGYSYETLGPYAVPSYVDAIGIMLNKSINPNYLGVRTVDQYGNHPLELTYNSMETSGSKYIYWFDMPTNRGYVELEIANGTSTPIGYTVSIVY